MSSNECYNMWKGVQNYQGTVRQRINIGDCFQKESMKNSLRNKKRRYKKNRSYRTFQRSRTSTIIKTWTISKISLIQKIILEIQREINKINKRNN